MDYISAKEAASKWGISERRVQVLCEKRRIGGVFRLGNAWAIPADALKPVDARGKAHGRTEPAAADKDNAPPQGTESEQYCSIKLQKDLESAVQAAQSASRAKSNFLSNMSHEMRTPMNAIMGMATIGKSAADLSRKDYAFGKIMSASSHLLGVINDILDMSKIEANRFELSTTEFDFVEMLRKVVNVISWHVDENKQVLNVSVEKGISGRFIGDDKRLAQVIANLLSNAVKFTPEGGLIRLDARLLNEEGGLCTVQIGISDNGIGISTEQQAGLFTSFEQVDSDFSRKYGGIGLGLTISKQIVEMMGGSIHVESEPCKGSTFTFTAKLERAPLADALSQPQGLSGPRAVDPAADAEAGLQEGGAPSEDSDGMMSFRGYCALLAEDIEINREIVLTLLEPTELEIICAVNGAEAARMFSENPDKYDVILMDVQMPEMDGMEATRRIRMGLSKKAKEIPIIAMTANVFSEDVEKCLESGMSDHVGKPIVLDELLETLRRYLSL